MVIVPPTGMALAEANLMLGKVRHPYNGTELTIWFVEFAI